MRSIVDNIKKETRFMANFLFRDNYFCNRMLNVLHRHEQTDPDELREWSRRKLLRTLRQASKTIPYYKKVRVNCTENDVEEFLKEKIPILSKEDLLRMRTELYPFLGKPRPWTIIGETGGTTAAAIHLFRSYGSVLWQNAFLKRQWTWAGVRDGMPRAVLRGGIIVPVEQSKPPFWYFNRYHNQLMMSSLHVRLETVDHYVDALERQAPVMMEAYASVIYELARYMALRNRFVSIPYIFTGSEQLYDHQRELIQERFRARVMDHYGMGERVTFATECEYGNMHLNTDHSYTEIVDESGYPTNDYGYIVGTTYHNLLMPLLRHKMTDMTKWKPGTCRCGRIYPMIERVKGRVEDIVYGTAGNDIGPMLFRVFYGIESIERAQIAQVDKNRLEIRIVPLPGFSSDDKKQLVSNLHKYVDPGMSATVSIVPELSRTPSGKFRSIVNEYVDGARDARVHEAVSDIQRMRQE